MPKDIVIVSAARTPIGSFLGSLASIPATQLGEIAIRGALSKINLDPKFVDEVLMGNVVQSNNGQAPARQAAIGAGIPNTVPCTTINKVCSSGMKAVTMAVQAIAAGDADVIVAGGMESMSNIPHYLYMRNAKKFGPAQLIDGLQRDGLVDAYDHNAMGVCADLCAKEHHVTREEQDEFAKESYRRSAKAWEEGKFDEEVVPVEIPQRRGEPFLMKEDEEYKNINFDKIDQLRPAFSKDGTATAANSSTINDGAGAVVLMSKEKAEELQLEILATVVSYADAAHEPERFTTAPAKALPIALRKANLELKDIDYFELNEAFSVVGIANSKLLGLDSSKVNIHGGAVSLGHPLGCSGVRILITLISILKQNNAKLGAALICNGGGGASAMVIKR